MFFAINLFKRIGNHYSVTKQLVEVAIKADDVAHDAGVITVTSTLHNLRTLRNDLVALSNGEDVVITPDDPRLASLELAVRTHKLL